MRALLATATLALAVTIPVLARADHDYPAASWPVASSPEAENCSTSGFAAYGAWLASKALTKPYGTVVIRHGKIVYEQYGNGATPAYTNDVGSLRKSIASALLGIAIDENKLTRNTTAYSLWPFIYNHTQELKDQAIEMHHLASMQSGWLDTVGPGAKWVYSNAGATAGGCVIGAAYASQYQSRWPQYGTGTNYIAPMVEDRIRDVIGAAWVCTHSAGTFNSFAYNPGPKMIVQSTMRDIARYGYLWLRDGEWANTQIVSRPYIRDARSNQVAAFTKLYGYWWCTNDNRAALPSAPADAFWHPGDGADGHRTLLLVVPSLDLVAACTIHDDDFDLTNGFAAQPARNPEQWAAALMPAILPDPTGTTKPTFVSEYLRDGTTGRLDAITNRTAVNATPSGLELTGDPVTLKLPDRTYTDQTVLLSVDGGMPIDAWAGVLVRGAATAPHGDDNDPHVHVIAKRRAGDGASIVEVRHGTQVLATAPVQQTDFSTTRFLLKVVTAGTNVKAWVNGESVIDLNGVPNPPGGGHTWLDGRVAAANPGVVRLKYFITRAATDGLVDVSYDHNDFCYLTIVEEGIWSSLQTNTFFVSVGSFRMGFASFWTIVFQLTGLWQQVAFGPEHFGLALRFSFGHGNDVTLEYKGDAEQEYIPY